jgi:hypothetical protein
MGRVHEFRAATVLYDAREGQHTGWDKWVEFTEIVFQPVGSARKQRRALYIQRILDDSGQHYVGPVNVRLGEYDVPSAGLREAVLTCSALRLVLDEEGAAALRKDEIRVELVLSDEQFAELRRELGRMLTDLGVYHEKVEE